MKSKVVTLEKLCDRLERLMIETQNEKNPFSKLKMIKEQKTLCDHINRLCDEIEDDNNADDGQRSRSSPMRHDNR